MHGEMGVVFTARNGQESRTFGQKVFRRALGLFEQLIIVLILPAVYDNRTTLYRIGISRVLDKGDEGQGVQGNPVVRPGCVVVLVHGPLGQQRGVLEALLWGQLPHVERPEGVGGQDVLPDHGHVDVPVVGSGAGLHRASRPRTWACRSRTSG